MRSWKETKTDNSGGEGGDSTPIQSKKGGSYHTLLPWNCHDWYVLRSVPSISRAWVVVPAHVAKSNSVSRHVVRVSQLQ